MYSLLVIASICILLIILMYIQSYRYKINTVTLNFSNLPATFDGTTILFISDIHRRKLSKKILGGIDANLIDFVFIGGDIVEEGVPLEIASDNISLLTSYGTAYFVWGNHDVKSNKEQLEIRLQQTGVNIIENKSVLLKHVKGDRLWLIGVGDVCSKQDKLDIALESIKKENGFRILLSHVPTITKKIKLEHRIALVLSGHTHGGQIALPWIGPITGGVGSLFPKQIVGHHVMNQTEIFISSGFGTSHLPLRFFTTPEVVVLTLKRKQE